MVDFYRKVEKIWDKISTYSEDVITQMWDIVKNYPKSIRVNPTLIKGVAKTIKRGLKSVDEMVNYANVPYINANTVEHILRGDGFNQGRHHISAVVADPNIQITHMVDKGNGYYKASLKQVGGSVDLTMNDKTFFPDDWSEFDVIDAIKSAHNSHPGLDDFGPNVEFVGQFNGRAIKIVKENGIIKTAFPF